MLLSWDDRHTKALLLLDYLATALSCNVQQTVLLWLRVQPAFTSQLPVAKHPSLYVCFVSAELPHC